MDENQSAVDIARLEEQIKTIFRRMDEIQSNVKDMQKLASSVDRMATTMETLTESMKEMKTDIMEIKKEPASDWKNFKRLLVSILSTGIVGGIVAALFALVVK